MQNTLQQHWETVYTTRQPHEVSWTEEVPKHSLDLIARLNLPPDAHIADIGGGDSRLVDHLLALGYTNITVVDISAAALERAKARLGPGAAQVHWVVSDVLDFVPERPIHLWHDRATFHFLTQPWQVQRYLQKLRDHVSGYVILAAFSTEGPNKCSGLPVHQYSEGDLCHLLGGHFSKVHCEGVTHVTPAQVSQAFVYCGFKKA
jgi:SAM-dependent methyltransferase